MLAATVHVSPDGDSRARASVAARNATRAIRGSLATGAEIARTRAASRDRRARRGSPVSGECLHATCAALRVASRRQRLANDYERAERDGTRRATSAAGLQIGWIAVRRRDD